MTKPASPVVAIAAVGRNGVIGSRGDLPWHIPDDLRRFKQITLGGALIMGRITFESIGRPLPGRTSIVVSRTGTPSADGVIGASSIEDALAKARELGLPAFVAGGAQLYRLAWPYLTDLDITEVDQAPDGDAFFPEIDPALWAQTARDQRDGFAFVHYVRRRP